MALPFFSNRLARVQQRDGMTFVELTCESISGEKSTFSLVLTRFAARSLSTGIMASDSGETAEIFDFAQQSGAEVGH